MQLPRWWRSSFPRRRSRRRRRWITISPRPAPGSWSYLPVPGGSEARFTDASATIRLTIRCDQGDAAGDDFTYRAPAPASSMFVWTSSATRNLPRPVRCEGMRVTADLAAIDPLLDAISFSRGRFVVSMPGTRMCWSCRPGRKQREPSRIAENDLHYKSCVRDRRIMLAWHNAAKGGDPMSHGSAEGSVRTFGR